MALFTTVITTPILKRAYPSPEAVSWEAENQVQVSKIKVQ